MRYAGTEIHRTFRSVREAIGFARSKAKGPQIRRPKYDDTHGSYTPPEVGSAIFAMLTKAGAPPGSSERAEVMRWACDKGQETPEVKRIHRAMRALMGEAGMLEQGLTLVDTERHAFTDTIGQAHEHLVELVAGVSRSEGA